MIGKVEFTVGKANYTFEATEGKDIDLLHKLIVLGNPPTICDACGEADKVVLDTNKDKDANIYINVKCLHCGAKAKLGTYKSGSYFWRRFELYQGKEN